MRFKSYIFYVFNKRYESISRYTVYNFKNISVKHLYWIRSYVRQFESCEMCTPIRQKGPFFHNMVPMHYLASKYSRKLNDSHGKWHFNLTAVVDQRKYEVYRRLVSEFTPLQNAPFQNFMYHKTCYRSFTRKQNLSAISLSLGEPYFESQENPAFNDTQVKTRSKLSPKFDWSTYTKFLLKKGLNKSLNLQVVYLMTKWFIEFHVRNSSKMQYTIWLVLQNTQKKRKETETKICRRNRQVRTWSSIYPIYKFF